MRGKVTEGLVFIYDAGGVRSHSYCTPFAFRDGRQDDFLKEPGKGKEVTLATLDQWSMIA